MKQNLTVLWLDDQRDPLKYFKKKDEKGEGTLHDNLIYYTNLSKQYNLSFVWVKNYKEFVNYIQTNGMPKFISFDHDLSKTSLPTDPKGLDCAKWLVNYCKETGTPMPMTYVHSANPKWRGVIRDILTGKMVAESKTIKLSESQLRKIITESIKSVITESQWELASQNSIDQGYDYEGELWSEEIYKNPEKAERFHAYIVSKVLDPNDESNYTEIYNIEDEYTDELIFPFWFFIDYQKSFMNDEIFKVKSVDGKNYIINWTTGQYKEI